ncbi:MAG: hypothetical protein HYR84_15910 [Planctomycetes bacterium]|nr:hypothetical protein [Planctomycetota bacterium]
MLLRVGNLRGVDLSIFDFDYDVQWCALMLTPDGAVLGRFGAADAESSSKYLTLPALRHSLEQALDRFKGLKAAKLDERKTIRPEDYPAAAKLGEKGCIHCHHVYEFRRDALQREGRWSLDDVWVHPEPENVGVTLDPTRGDRVLAVKAKSPASELGIHANDVIRRIGNAPIASVADVRQALHQGPTKGAIEIVWRNGEHERRGMLPLAEGWRKTDVSWRWSLKSLSPSPSIVGDDLSMDERKKLGLAPRQLAYRQMNFLTPTARHAGLHANDIIVGINDQAMSMTARQFETHIRLYCKVGQEITLNVMRGKERVKVKLKLPE